MKNVLIWKKWLFAVLIIAFSVIESVLVLSHPQFGNNFGAFQFKYVYWDEKETAYCYTYKNENYRTIRIWAEEKQGADTYKIRLESMEDVIVNQTERIIIVPDREGITDFDHYKKVFDSKSYGVINKVIKNKTQSTIPQNILFLVFIVFLNSGFASMIVYPEKVKVYKNLLSPLEKNEKVKLNTKKERIYKIVGFLCMIILLAACFF